MNFGSIIENWCLREVKTHKYVKNQCHWLNKQSNIDTIIVENMFEAFLEHPKEPIKSRESSSHCEILVLSLLSSFVNSSSVNFNKVRIDDKIWSINESAGTIVGVRNWLLSQCLSKQSNLYSSYIIVQNASRLKTSLYVLFILNPFSCVLLILFIKNSSMLCHPSHYESERWRS